MLSGSPYQGMFWCWCQSWSNPGWGGYFSDGFCSLIFQLHGTFWNCLQEQQRRRGNIQVPKIVPDFPFRLFLGHSVVINCSQLQWGHWQCDGNTKDQLWSLILAGVLCWTICSQTFSTGWLSWWCWSSYLCTQSCSAWYSCLWQHYHGMQIVFCNIFRQLCCLDHLLHDVLLHSRVWGCNRQYSWLYQSSCVRN